MADSANVLHIKLYWPEFFLGRALQWFEEICSYAMCSILCHARLQVILKGSAEQQQHHETGEKWEEPLRKWAKDREGKWGNDWEP